MVNELPGMAGLEEQLDGILAVIKLKEFLFKLGIRSAGRSADDDRMNLMMHNAINSGGTPDQIYMPPNMYDAFQKAFVKKS